MIFVATYLEHLPTEIIQTFIFPYLGHNDLDNLRKLNNLRLKQIVEDYKPCKIKKVYS